MSGRSNPRLEVTISEQAAPTILLRAACSWIVVISSVTGLIVFVGFAAVAASVDRAALPMALVPLVVIVLQQARFTRLVYRASRALHELVKRVAEERA